MAIPDDTPLAVQNGAFETLQTGFFVEGENASGNGSNFRNRSNMSNGRYREFSRRYAEDVFFDLNVNYTIPADDVGFAARVETFAGGHNSFDLNVNGETIASFESNSISAGLKWINTDTTGITNDLTPGTYEARLVGTGTDSGGDMGVDCMFVFDDRFEYTFDNSTDGNDTLVGPQLFPDQVAYWLAEENLTQPAESATVTQTWNDISGGQFVEVNLAGNASKTTNGTTATASSPDDAVADTISVRVGLSRFGSRSNTTPREGFKGQSIDDHKVTADPDSVLRNGIGQLRTRIRTPDGDLSAYSGDLVEAGTVDANDVLLTRGLFSSFAIPSQMAITSNELLAFDRD
jgi:hypothetical protein